MNIWKILSLTFGGVCFISAVSGHYVIGGILFVVAVLCAQRGAVSPPPDKHDGTRE